MTEPGKPSDSNPYQTPPVPDKASDSGRQSLGHYPPVQNLSEEEAEQLRRRQMRLVIRLAVLSVATTVAAVAAVIVAGFEPVSSAIVIALILGIGFTVVWKV